MTRFELAASITSGKPNGKQNSGGKLNPSRTLHSLDNTKLASLPRQFGKHRQTSKQSQFASLPPPYRGGSGKLQFGPTSLTPKRTFPTR